MWDETGRIFIAAFRRTEEAIAGLLPGLLAMLAIVLAAVLLAILVRRIVRRACERLELDRRLRAWGVAPPPAEGRAGPSHLVARFAGWTVLAIGFLAGLSVFETSTSSGVSARLLAYAPHALIGTVLLAAGAGLSRVVERSVLIGAVNMGLQSARLLGLGARWLVLIVATAMALEHLGLGSTTMTVAFGILFGGIVLTLALAVGLGAKDAVARSLERHLPPAGEPPPARPDEHDVHHL